MKLKLDENLGARGADLLRQEGHDVTTVAGQGLCSSTDHTLIAACRREGRCLVSLDMDFGNPLRFKPSDYPGIAVLRLPAKPSHELLLYAVKTLIAGLARSTIAGRLWIIQPGRIREYQQEDLEEP